MSNVDPLWTSDADVLPAAPGAYVLRLDLARAAALPPRFGGGLLPAGVYLYCGSARGPGGLRARCRRHLAAEKGLRWHVDWLSTAAACRAVHAVPDGDECALAAALAAVGCGCPVTGFGSSDCRACTSHLLVQPDHVDIKKGLQSFTAW